MNCPACNIPLAMADKQGIEVDYCPKCRGVWLDRGELEKLIERSNSFDSGYGKEQYPYDHDHHYEKDAYSGKGDHQKYRKRKSFFSELFD